MHYFTSDVHLNKENKALNQIFINWLNQLPENTQALYMLGDIFDAWHPSYMQESWCQQIIQALRLNSKRFKIYLMHGNHDFLIDQKFAKTANITLIQEDVILVGDIILLHGDILATEDKPYQMMRKIIRSSLIQTVYKALPEPIQLTIIKLLKNNKNPLSETITFNLQAITKLHHKYPQAKQMIFGHFHKLHRQKYTTHSNQTLKVQVLACWNHQPEYIVQFLQDPLAR